MGIDLKIRRWLAAFAGLLLICGGRALDLHTETGEAAWLRYAPLDAAARAQYASLPQSVIVLGDTPVLLSARQELILGVQGMLGKTLVTSEEVSGGQTIILGLLPAIRADAPALPSTQELRPGSFWITTARVRGAECLMIAGGDDRGVLYGVFALLSKIARGESIAGINEVQYPYAERRWVDEWDNLDGSIERGYGGRSIFFENGAVRDDLTRAAEYARLLASIGIHGCAINNVNADPRILSDDFLPQLARVAEVFRPWGVQLAVSVNFTSPRSVGGLDTFDPIDPRVAEWWKKKVNEIYRAIPDFGGFVVKADSEGQPGPASYGRTPDDAANVIARALAPHGGVVFYRAFVYNHHLDWRNPKNDRARAAYDIFHPLDGKFDDNVILQIKNGPIDFQVREPVSPLFGGLLHTREAIELQITQEYTGQQRHLCFLAPMWKEVLDFDLHATGDATPMKDLVAGKTFNRPGGGLVGVANVGLDLTWLGNPLALANLYGFGRLAWDPNLSVQQIDDEWTRLTFGNDPEVVRTITAMQLTSWHIYENYTGPLGAGTLTDILGSHYGPAIESSERNGWGQWHRADHDGIGMDRTVATGTGFVGQYSPPVALIYENLKTTPDNLLLFFHHVPYTYVLHSGKTVIQYIYDSHYEGAQQAADLVRQWKPLHGRIDNQRYAAELARLEYQAGAAIVWRDAICNWFARTSGIPDAQGRVGHHPDRLEAESMQLEGYAVADVTPWETASGGKAIVCPPPAQNCTASFKFTREAGTYDLDVQYFDQNNGESKFRLLVNGQLVDEWTANDTLPSTRPDGASSTCRVIPSLSLKPGDEIRIEGVPDKDERAPLDYFEIKSEKE